MLQCAQSIWPRSASEELKARRLGSSEPRRLVASTDSSCPGEPVTVSSDEAHLAQHRPEGPSATVRIIRAGRRRRSRRNRGSGEMAEAWTDTAMQGESNRERGVQTEQARGPRTGRNRTGERGGYKRREDRTGSEDGIRPRGRPRGRGRGRRPRRRGSRPSRSRSRRPTPRRGRRSR